MKRRTWLDGLTISVCIVAAIYFGGRLGLNLIKREVKTAIMENQIEHYLDPAERLFVLEQIHDVLQSRHKGDPQLWQMPLTDLINRPGSEFDMTSAELGVCRRLYMKFRITEGNE